MLHFLSIRNLAVVEKTDIDFQAGMTVITGETGAGKSILLDALNLALGQRMDTNVIRAGADYAEISASFDLAHLPGAILWLNDLELSGKSEPDSELDSELDNECLIRRVLYKNGRSRAYINGKAVTTQQLKLLGEFLVQIHGQHDHQLLLKPNEQLRIIDAFGQHQELADQTQKAHLQLQKCLQEKNALLNQQSQEHRLSLLEYQLSELEELNLEPFEWEQLHTAQKQLTHATENIQFAEKALSILEAADSYTQKDIAHLLYDLSESLQKLSPQPKLILEMLGVVHTHIQEITASLNHYYQRLEVDPQKLYDTEARLSKIFDLSRKHKVKPEDLILHLQTLTSELEALKNREAKLAGIDKEIEQAHAHFLFYAEQLSCKRKQAAQQLSLEITERIQTLGLAAAKFSADLIPLPKEKPAASGLESILFSVSANPGLPLQPMHKIASGGELSRISLAIQLASASYLNTPTLIFDEVDVGIGGKIGALVGKCLQTLGKQAQVICVTHLPQVAACGNYHITVSKTDSKTELNCLTQDKRSKEIARMLEGFDQTPETLAHAEQLLRSAHVLSPEKSKSKNQKTITS